MVTLTVLKVRLIPSLLLLDGLCVKGVNFRDFRNVGNPVTNAKIYDAQGADELLFLDVSASRESRQILLDIVSETAEQCFMPLTVGGGVRTVEDARNLFRAGADKVSLNTGAVANPELVREAAREFGSSNIVVAIDYKARPDGTLEVHTHSGTEPSGLDPLLWAQQAEQLGAGEIILTSIDHEGTRRGYDIATIRAVADVVRVPVIAAGGAGTTLDIVDAIEKGGASAASAGSIFHFTDQSVIEARYHMRNSGLHVRIA